MGANNDMPKRKKKISRGFHEKTMMTMLPLLLHGGLKLHMERHER
jgi:hypothetical protein